MSNENNPTNSHNNQNQSTENTELTDSELTQIAGGAAGAPKPGQNNSLIGLLRPTDQGVNVYMADGSVRN